MTKKPHLSHTTSKLIVSQLVSFCMRRGWSADDLFRYANLNLAQLRLGQQLLVREDFIYLLSVIAKKQQLPDIALQLGQDIHSEQLGLFGALISSSPNLTVAVQLFSEFNQLLDDRFKLSLSVENGELWLVYKSPDSSISHPFYSELLFSAIAAHANQFSRLDAAPLTMEFAHPAPEYAGRYGRYFSCPVGFEAAQNRMQLPPHAANAPFATQDKRYHEHVLAEAVKLLSSQPLARSEQITTYLQTRIGDASACTLESVCDFLKCSTRTLQRELKSEQLSFKQLVDDTRKRLACERLAGTDKTVEAIAQSVGFEHPSSFSAKFKQWTGLTPRQYRNQNRSIP